MFPLVSSLFLLVLFEAKKWIIPSILAWPSGIRAGWDIKSTIDSRVNWPRVQQGYLLLHSHHIRMQTQANTNTGGNRWDSAVQIRTVWLTSDFGSLTRGERHNSYYANQAQRAAHLVMFKNSVGRDSKNLSTSSTALIKLLTFNSASMAETQLSTSMVECQLSTDLKSSNSQDHLFRTWGHPHSSPISCWGLLWKMVIVISFAHERKTVPNDYAPELRAE